MTIRQTDRPHRRALSDNQRAILRALDAGHTTLRAIMEQTGITTTSIVAYNLRVLAQRELCVLEDRGPSMQQVYDGREYAAGWDAAAAVAGNPEA